MPGRLLACLVLLLATVPSSASPPVRVLLRLHAPAGTGGAGFPSSRSEALSRLARLRQASHAAQKRLIEHLPRVRGVATRERAACGYWLTNCVAVSADESAIRELSAHPDVKSVHVLARVPCPKSVAAPASSADQPEYTWGLEMLHVPQIRALWGLTGKGIRVGHLDTGVAADHPDLRGKVIAWRDFTPARKPAPYDPEGHGTHTAATIVGGNASGRWIGVAPDARLISARIFSPDGADPEEILAAMQWVVDPDGNPATDDGAHLVSNSWGTDDTGNRVFWDAVQRWVELGVFPCFAAGNNGPGTVGSPAGYPHAFAVGGTSMDRTIGDYSSRGPTRWDGKELTKPDVVAPGTEILSAHAKGNLYQSLSGTSMAAPHVSGIIALMLEAKRDLKVDEIRRLLESTAIDLGDPGKDNLHGHGLIDPLRVIGALEPSAQVTGVVRDAAGKPVANAEVAVPHAHLTVATDGEGHYRLVLPPGTWSVVARAGGLSWARAELALSAGEARAHDVLLPAAAAAHLEGRVTVQGEPRPLAARVVLPGTDHPAVQTDPSTGAFTLDVPEGRHAVLVVAPGFAPSFHPAVAFTAGRPVRLDVALAPRPDVLVVDDDESDLLERYYTDALAAAGRSWSVWDTRRLGEVPRDVLLAYPVVVWQTGFDYVTALTPSEQALVRAYLASGGHLWFAAQVAAATLRDTGFFGEVLHAAWHGMIKREGGVVPPIRGVAGDPIGDGLAFALNGSGSQENHDFPTMIGAASAAASPIATYVAAPGANGNAPPLTGPAAIRVDTGTYRVVYTGFGLDGIPEAGMRHRLTARIMAWLAPTAESAAARVALVDEVRGRAAAAHRADADEWADTSDRLLDQARAELGRARDPWRALASIREGPHGERLAAVLRRGLRR